MSRAKNISEESKQNGTTTISFGNAGAHSILAQSVSHATIINNNSTSSEQPEKSASKEEYRDFFRSARPLVSSIRDQLMDFRLMDMAP